MATTVFPVTDQVVTTTLWDALNSAIDRGSALTGLSGLTGSVDTNYVKYNRPSAAGTTTSDLTERTYCNISLDAGGIYHVMGTFVVNKTADTTDDQLNCGFNMDSGMEFRGVTTAGTFAGTARTTYTLIGDSDTFVGLDSLYAARGTNGVSYTDQAVFWVNMVVVANQDGDLSFSYAKKTDTYATTYQPPGDRSYLKAVRIF